MEELTINKLHDAILEGQVTCVEIVRSYLNRIQAYDVNGPKINSIIATNSLALRQAAELDEAFSQTHELSGSLHCVPVVLKDNYNTVDMPTSGGVKALETSQSLEDAHAVKLLREAGAIMLAKANLSELAMSPAISDSSLGGQTLNPYDLMRSPGGSSGGTGAAVAANFGLIGTGSDTGQSIRSPSSANSLVGIRPTRGLVSREGVIPLSPGQDEIGPITRTVEDAARALQVMVGYDRNDPITGAGVGNVGDYVAALNP